MVWLRLKPLKLTEVLWRINIKFNWLIYWHFHKIDGLHSKFWPCQYYVVKHNMPYECFISSPVNSDTSGVIGIFSNKRQRQHYNHRKMVFDKNGINFKSQLYSFL